MQNFGLVYGPKPVVKDSKAPLTQSEMYAARNRDAVKRFMKELAPYDTGMELAGRYFGRNKSCEFRCPKGHLFVITPGGLIKAAKKGSQACSVCNGNPSGRGLDVAARIIAAEHQEKLDSFGTGIKILAIDEMGDVGLYRDANGREFEMALEKMIKMSGSV
jgi:hypothetical protein